MRISPAVTTKVFSALDNEHSLYPLWVKDLIDNAGRSAMEYNRGGVGANHAGRERMIEEFSTTLVWLAGRKALEKWILNPMMRWKGLDPKVDIMLFLKKNQQAIPQWILSRKNDYLKANIAKFLIGTIIPVAIIGWVIPSINQAITRFQLSKESTPKVSEPQKSINFEALHTLLSKNSGSIASSHQVGLSPTGLRGPLQQPAWAAAQPYPRFGGNAGLLEGIANLINSEFYGNVAIDMGISGGRLYKARNWVDRTEVAIREGSIVLFLYFLGDYVKGHLKRWFDKSKGVFTGLTYDSLAWLKKKQFKPELWKEQLAFFKGLTGKNAFDEIAKRLNPLTGRFDKDPILELARLQNKLHVLSSKESLPLTAFRKIFGGKVSSTKHHYLLDPRKLVDVEDLKGLLISAPAEEDALKRLLLWLPRQMGLFKRTSSHVAPGLATRLMKVNSTRMPGMLALTGRYKTIALLSSYVISGVCIGWLAPKFQHWVTYKLTGKVDFPGVRKDV